MESGLRTSTLAAAAVFLLAPASNAVAQSTTLPAADRALRATESEIYRIGGMNAPQWAAFEDLRQVAFDSAGTLYALETRGARVIRIRNNGTLIGQLGRRGQGPGEYSLPINMAVFPDGRVVLRDLSRRSFMQFDPAGQPGPELNVTFPDGDAGRIEPAGHGRIAFATDIVLVNGGRVLSGKYDTPATSVPVGVVTLGQPQARTAVRAWLPPYVAPRERFARALLGPVVSWSALADGSVVVADTLSWRLTIAGGDGSRRTIIRPLAARKTAAADRTWALADYRTRMIDPSGRPRIGGVGANGAQPPTVLVAEVERGIAASTVADELQIIRKIGTDWNNRIWVQRIGTTVSAAGPIDIVEPSGRYIGTLPPQKFPDAFGPDGLVAYLEKDANDVQLIVVKRLSTTG